MTRLLIASIVLTLMVAKSSYAQPTHPFSMDLSVGVSTAAGGHYFDRSGFAGEITLVPEHEAGGIVALTVGGRGSFASGDVCAWEAGPGTRCLPRFPATAHLGLLGGLERRVSGVTLRMLGGPAFYGGAGVSGMGSQLQLDAAAGAEHFALVMVTRGSLIKRFNGESQGLWSVALGLRVR